jgi:hypothetical protein
MVGAFGVAGTVVTATVTDEETGDVPAALAAVTLMVYVTADVRFCTTIGEDDPVAVLVV